MRRTYALLVLGTCSFVLGTNIALAQPHRHHHTRYHASHHHYTHQAALRTRSARNHTVQIPQTSFSSSPLVADARRYIGTNPTGRRSLWCGAFMDKVLRDNGFKGGGNLALGYLHYGHRVAGPKVGAIAVMGRRGGGHVGVVSGVTPKGDPVVISGNHSHTTAESVYPRSRVIAYVMPN